MEQLLQNEEIVRQIGILVGIIVSVLGIILTALAYRVARAIEGAGAQTQALTQEERVRRIARDAVAAVEQLHPQAGPAKKLAEAIAYGRTQGIDLPRGVIEAALKEAEGAWRQPDWVRDQAWCAELTLEGPEGSE